MGPSVNDFSFTTFFDVPTDTVTVVYPNWTELLRYNAQAASDKGVINRVLARRMGRHCAMLVSHCYSDNVREMSVNSR